MSGNPPDPADHFAAIVRGLVAVFAHLLAWTRTSTPRLVIANDRILRTAQRLDRLIARWRAGADLTPRPRAPRSRLATPRPYAPNPRGHAWLVREHQQAAQFAPQVETFLARPDIRALAEAAPQAGRLLRPLCRMFGIAPPAWLRLPDRPRPEPKPIPPRPRLTRDGLLPTDRPFPAYVRRAIRAWKPRYG